MSKVFHHRSDMNAEYGAFSESKTGINVILDIYTNLH